MDDQTAAPTLDPQALADALCASATLADVTIRLPGIFRTDKEATDEIKKAKGASAGTNVGAFRKNILAGADKPYRDAANAYAELRKIHARYTLPWVTNANAGKISGPRLLPNAIFHAYSAAMSAQKNIAVAARQTFLDAYPDLVRQARGNLAGLADDEEDYPNASEMERQFDIYIDIVPVPNKSGYQGLHESTLKYLSGTLVSRTATAMQMAREAAIDAVRERVGTLYKVLVGKSPTGKLSPIHETTYDDVQALIDTLPAWDLSAAAGVPDQLFDTLVAWLKRALRPDGIAITVHQLRDSETLREATAKLLEEPLALAGWQPETSGA